MKKVLLVRLSSLGDVIFNIPLANVLKRSGFEVHWLVGPKGIAVIKDNPCVDKAVFAQKGEYFKTLRRLRAEKYDIVMDTHGMIKSAVYTLFCGAKRRVMGTDARECAWIAATELVKIPKDRDFKDHISKKYLKYAQHLGLDIENAPVTLPAVSADVTLPEGKPVAVLCPATTWDNKHWNKGNWKVLAAELSKKYNLVFTGTAGDSGLIEYIGGGIPHLNLAGKTSLHELIQIFRRADLVVSLDSGSTHLAWGSGAKKIVAIFCATPKVFYTPPGHTSAAGNLPCQPCHKRRCPLKHMDCTNFPTAQEVIELCK